MAGERALVMPDITCALLEHEILTCGYSTVYKVWIYRYFKSKTWEKTWAEATCDPKQLPHKLEVS